MRARADGRVDFALSKSLNSSRRYCGWGPGQLESECERGVWYPVSAAKELSLKQVIQLPKPLWREVSELCGGELADMAVRAYEGAEQQEQAFKVDNLDAEEDE